MPLSTYFFSNFVDINEPLTEKIYKCVSKSEARATISVGESAWLQKRSLENPVLLSVDGLARKLIFVLLKRSSFLTPSSHLIFLMFLKHLFRNVSIILFSPLFIFHVSLPYNNKESTSVFVDLKFSFPSDMITVPDLFKSSICVSCF